MVKFAVTTLKNRCLDELAKNVDTLIEDLDDQSKVDLKKLIQRKWSDDLLQRVKGPLRERHASFFINAHLIELALHRFAPAEIEEIIQILKTQGDGILHLSFMGSLHQRYSEVTVLHLTQSLPTSLTCLRFENIECSGASLSIVARDCPNLQKLHLTDCKRVTNYGIAALFLKADGSPNTVMQFLDLSGTSVTERGILMTLEYCPNMTELIHHRLNHALKLAYQHSLRYRRVPSKPCKLKTLTTGNSSLTPIHFLRPWQMFCPHVQNLSVRYLDSQTEMNICSEFQNLKSASLHSSKPLSLSSFLEIRGSELQHLQILGQIIVCVDSVIKFCPNLMILRLCTPRFGRYLPVEAIKYSLKNLQTLEMSLLNVTFAKREMAALFLSSPNLESVMFWHVSGFTDDFASLIAMHDIVNLRYFQVLCCDIHMSTLKKIIMASPSLTHVSITLCDNISQEDKKYLETLRNDLTISYVGEVSPFFLNIFIQQNSF